MFREEQYILSANIMPNIAHLIPCGGLDMFGLFYLGEGLSVRGYIIP